MESSRRELREDMVLPPLAVSQEGLKLIKVNWKAGRDGLESRETVENFKAHYGSSRETVANIWEDLLFQALAAIRGLEQEQWHDVCPIPLYSSGLFRRQ
jgi:hypothetical protein